MSATYNEAKIALCIRGIIPTDEKYKKMKAIWDNCKALGISVPIEICDFFVDPEPCAQVYAEGMAAKLPANSIKTIDRNSSNSYIVDLRKIPEDIKLIVFEISY